MTDPFRTIGELEQTLLSRKKTNRAGLPGLEKSRKEKEVIAAGAIIIRTIMETFGMPSVLVSDRGLREGVLIDLATRTCIIASRPLGSVPNAP
jgi:exopolyphosphatase / guanosine-5'-triphosphate,3'-diphosphate pyrophosphatase